LTERDEEFMEKAIDGMHMLRLLANFSDQIIDITNMNFEVSNRILVWIQRAVYSDFFKDKMGYIGTLMSSI